ncbi:MAG: hypothetical protein EOP64_07515 [Sphingomonas sp.]|nr:MAG: hypothetical protein EOP64_07515 [Sphingomonas sp.]
MRSVASSTSSNAARRLPTSAAAIFASFCSATIFAGNHRVIAVKRIGLCVGDDHRLVRVDHATAKAILTRRLVGAYATLRREPLPILVQHRERADIAAEELLRHLGDRIELWPGQAPR